MIPIKIQCGCGQRYAFDVEPVDGHMPYAVACPVCGVDGTAAANTVIAQAAPAEPVPASEAPPTSLRLRVATPQRAAGPAAVATSSHRPASHHPAKDFTSAKSEAQSKINWGDPPEKVTRFLMMQGMDASEADDFVRELSRARAQTVRGEGVKKIIVGCGLVCVPIVALVVFLSVGYLPLKTFAVTVLVGLWGLWKAFRGTFMLLLPRLEHRDIADL